MPVSASPELLLQVCIMFSFLLPSHLIRLWQDILMQQDVLQ